MIDTTVTIDVTATTFPSTVRSERSLFAQIAWRAIRAESRICCMRPASAAGGRRALGVLISQLDLLAIRQGADVREGAGDHLIPRLDPREHLEVLLAGDTHFHRHEHRTAV